jgi:hypothetical protein
MMDDRPPAIPAPLRQADPRILRFLDAWRAARGGALAPVRTDFDPSAVADLLAWIWLARFEEEVGDFVYRLAGEEVNAIWGRSLRGVALADLLGPADHPTVLQRWFEILEGPSLHYGLTKERLSALENKSAERLLAPLADPDGRICWVIGLSLYRIRAVEIGRPPLVADDYAVIPASAL